MFFEKNKKMTLQLEEQTREVQQLKQNIHEQTAMLEAINKAQAVIQFELDGTIIDANENFCQAMGYTLQDIRGKHHSLFVSTAVKNSDEYRDFWQKLNRGEFNAGEFKRLGSGGREIWIQASYNPVFDEHGRPYKVVKFATDITQQKILDADFSGQIDAVSKSQAVIEFSLDGSILKANDNFCQAMAYTPQEIQGQHHRMFVDDVQANSLEYREFWAKLNRGEYVAGEFKRIAKGGREVWIQASYNPILDLNGRPYKVVKYATDITAQKVQASDYQGQIQAVGKSQAVIEFHMDGHIITANENFCQTMGYQLADIQGKHHRMFAEESLRNSPEYHQFWQQLARGDFIAGEFKRIGYGGREIWIQASYNPILDLNGNPFKVVKYATDITQEKLQAADFQGQIEAVGKSQAVIEFEMDGTIITANDNFCQAMGYTLEEIQGKKHSLFAESSLKNSPEYQAFWATLNRGEYSSGEYKRIGKGGREVWIQASYNPIMDLSGKPFKVVKYASEITEQKLQAANFSGQIEAVGKSQAVIEFEMNGSIITANDNFCSALGYSLNEIKGQHHRIFVDAETKNSPEYSQFWARLNRGEFVTGEFKRIGKAGNEVWIQASYNPIFDLNGQPFKVVKYATEVTGRVQAVAMVKESLLNLEQGNLDAEIHIEFEQQFVALKDAINNMSGQLKGVVSEVNASAISVSAASNQIVSANADLSTRTENQAASLEETASSMEEMTAALKQSSDNARRANDMAKEARANAVKGGEVVEEAVVSMEQINESSKKINDIIGVIDEIAFQTNLLALNAAVEAARAGEQGRGFAVVAGEVRNLAQRSAGAAKEIKDLIRDSVEKIENGSQLVNRSGETLKEIVGSVRSVSEIITEISEASEEQSAGISQVNESVSMMDEMTQQNAALVEQISASGESMAEQAQKMNEVLSYFNNHNRADQSTSETLRLT
jgi:methyl-accepting chemotaxis protein